MPPRKVSFAQGCYYHLYNRGAARQAIFCVDENYRFFLERLKRYAGELCISVIAYCLIPNHYHLLLRQDGQASAGRAVQLLANGYAKAFNRRYGRTGALFEGRFKAISVDDESYLVQLCRYIHANPVRHGLTRRVDDWPHSNYHEWIGARQGWSVDRELVAGWFPAVGDYVRFVAEYVENLVEAPRGLARYVVDE